MALRRAQRDSLPLIGFAALTLLFSASSCGESPAQPTASFTSSPSGMGISGVTVFTFTGAAVDVISPTYSWDFGDGSTGAGATATHVYANDGRFTVTLRVDAGGRSAASSSEVSVGNLSGRWVSDPVNGVWHELNAVQKGVSITGQWIVHVNPGSPWYKPNGPNTDVSKLTGSVGSPRIVGVAQGGECLRAKRNGTVNETLTAMQGSEGSYGNPDCHVYAPWSFSRR